MMSIRERYEKDPVFRRMVQTLVSLIEQGQITPTEAREAAMLAQLLYEERHPRQVVFSREEFLGGQV